MCKSVILCTREDAKAKGRPKVSNTAFGMHLLRGRPKVLGCVKISEVIGD